MDPSPGVIALLFTDLVGSTRLLERLGDDAAEELRHVHFALLREAVAKSSGQEVKSLGDGIMVAFASPVDAVGCAVAMQAAVRDHNEQGGGHRLEIRIGLHAGDPHREAGDFHGTAVVVASRLCDAATGGQILASELLAELVGSRGGFSFRPGARLSLKGLDRPVATVTVDWNAGEPSGAPIPVPTAPARTLSPPSRPRGPELVGRDGVLAELEAELDRARPGELRCVLLLGEPGVGKTRLTGEFVAGHAGELTALSARAYPLGATASLGLWVEALERHLRQLGPAEIRDLCGPYLDDLAALFGSLAPLTPPRAGPEPSRVRILEGLVGLLEGVAGNGPLVVVLDDVHLADGSSWEALAFLARSLSSSPILILLAGRPVELAEQPVATEVLLALDQEGLLRRISLSPLTSDDVRRLADETLGRRAVPEVLVGWLMDRTQGNPLFVLGLIRALVEEGADLEAPALRHLPENLAERVTSRLGSLGEAELGLLELLAVVGRPVELDDLIALSGQDGGRLDGLLPPLVRSRLVAEEDRGGELTYGIAHPLVQEALYHATGGARRRTLHRSAGRALLAVNRLGEAASHFARAARSGDPEAVSVLLAALRQAEERQTYRESLALLRSLVHLLPSGDERWLDVVDAIGWEANWLLDQPAELEVALGIAALREMDAVLEGRPDPARQATVKFRLAASISWGEGRHDEAKRLYGSARDLFVAAGNHHGARLSSNEVAFVSGMGCDFEAMEAGAKAALEAAEEAEDPVVARRALATIGWSAFFRGRFALAEESYRRAVGLTRKEETFRLTLTLSGLAVLLALEGRLSEGLALIEEAKRLNPAHRATPLSEWETRIHWLAGDFPAAVAGTRDLLTDRSRVLSPRTSMGLPFAAISAAEMGLLEEAERYLALAEAAPGGRFFIVEPYCGFAAAVLAGRRGETAEAISGLGMVADSLLGMEALPFAAFVLAEQAEEAGRSGDAPAAAHAARRLEEIAGQIDRPLYRALSAQGAAWSHVSTGAGPPSVAAAQEAVSILANLGYHVLSGRAFDVLGCSLRSVDPSAARAAFEQAIEAFDSCGAVWRRDRIQAGRRGSD